MPKYELMYILSSAVTDNDMPIISAEVDKFITDHEGKILSQEMMGKKKLAYPIKKTRNGFYVLTTFNAEGSLMKSLDNKLRSIESIIRYLVVNLDEADIRKEKDRKIQEKIKAARRPVKIEPATIQQIDITMTDTELEKKIEQALESEDLAK
jgi:small subunit ribosomal protein S6